MKKYELTDETKTFDDGTVLHRIRAVKDFALVDGTKVHKGDRGGWIEREINLSQVGKSWVCGGRRRGGGSRLARRRHGSVRGGLTEHPRSPKRKVRKPTETETREKETKK